MENFQAFEVPSDLLRFVKNKNISAKAYFRYFLARTVKMFQYDGLPDSIPAKILERLVQVNGVAVVTEVNGSLYVFSGSLGGEYDVYYRPSKFIIANPHLKASFSKEVDIVPPEISQLDPSKSNQGVLLYNDSEWFGLTPLIGRYSALLAENILTMRTSDVMLRLIATLSAPTDKSLKSAMEYLSNIEKGELGVIGDDPFFDGVQVHAPATSNGSYFKQFIEFHQYILGTFYGELGLRANYNMKREAIGAGETALDEDAVLPLVDNMLECRREWVSRLNQLYNLSISVNFSSAWLNNRTEYLLSLSQQLQEAGITVPSSPSSPSSSTTSGSASQLEMSENDESEVEVEKSGDELGQQGSTVTETDVLGEAEESILDEREEAPDADKYGGSEVNDIHGNDEVETVAELVEEFIENYGEEKSYGQDIDETDALEEKATEDEASSEIEE